MRTKAVDEEQEIVDKANALARKFYAMQGYAVPEGYKFHEAHHPQEMGMWEMAREAMLFLTGTDPDDAVACIE